MTVGRLVIIVLVGLAVGVEQIRVVLMFDVLWFEPGADLTVRNVVVR